MGCPENEPGKESPKADGAASATPRSLDDPLVIQRLQECRAALERGERPDRRKLLAEFPEIAEELASCLDALDLVEHVVPKFRGSGAGPGSDPPNGDGLLAVGQVGEYRILRQIGRGGMGVVYEAEQISLGRRVALKVLPFAAVFDPRHLQRFKNEAQAAAALEHPNIVNIYSVGCERGVHYCAMQYIDGQTLAQVIQQLRETNGAPKTEATLAPTTPLDQVGWGGAKRSPSDGPDEMLGLRPSLPLAQRGPGECEPPACCLE